MTRSAELYGARLEALLHLEGITQTEAAARLGMSQGSVSKLINGVNPLSAELVNRLALEFGVPRSFFARPTRDSDRAAVTFRKKSTTRSVEERRVGVLSQLANDLWREASQKSGYYPFTPPDVHELDVEDSAVMLREMAGLRADAPVPSVTRMVERMGIAVVANLDPQRSYGTDMAGISRPSASEDRPVIATLAPKRGDVQRMTIAHELAHLLYDNDLKNPPTARSPQERRAFEFAGALLLPEAPMRESVNERSTLPDLLRVKARFGTSLMAIVTRAQRLHLISEMRAKSLYGQINARGWRYQEPVEVSVERPTLFAQAAARAWPGFSPRRIAEATGVPRALISAWIGLPDNSAVHEDGQVIDLAARRSKKLVPSTTHRVAST